MNPNTQKSSVSQDAGNREEPVTTFPLERRDLIPKTLSKWFWDLYDGVLYWLIMNLAVFFLGSIWTMGVYLLTAPLNPAQDAPLLARYFLAGIQMGLIVIPVNAFALSWMMPYARGFTHYTDGDFQFVHRGLKKKKAFALISIVQFAVTFFLIFNILFYITREWPQPMFRWGGYLLAGLFFWVLVFANAILLFCAPMIADDKWTWKEMLKRSMFIVVMHKIFTLSVMIVLGLIWAAGIKFKLIGLALFCHVATVTLINAAYQSVVDHHRAVEVFSELTEKAETIRPKTWKEKTELENRGVMALVDGTASPTRYQRSIRDILKPWE